MRKSFNLTISPYSPFPSQVVFTVRCACAKRGLAIACCLSVCDVRGLWSHRLEFSKNNFTVS